MVGVCLLVFGGFRFSFGCSLGFASGFVILMLRLSLICLFYFLMISVYYR